LNASRLAVLVALIAVLGIAGLFMDVTIFIMALGLCNIALVVFLLLRKDLTWGFLFYLTTVIFFQTGFWIRLPGFPDLYPARVSSILLFLAFLIQMLMSMRKVPPLGLIEKSMIVFLVLMFVSIISLGQKPAWLLLMRGYIYPFIFFYFARAVVNRERQLKLVFGYLTLVGIYFAFTGIFEQLRWYEFVWPRFIADPTVADHGLSRLGVRVRIFLQPAILGLVMVIGPRPTTSACGIMPMTTRIVLLITTPVTIFFTETRSVYLALLLSLIIAAIWSRGMRVLSIGMILAGAVAAFLNWDNLMSEDRSKGGMGTMNTVHYRIELMYETAEMFMDHPFFGVGFMNFQEAAVRYRKPRDVPIFGHIDVGSGGQAVSHNMLVTIIAEQGAMGPSSSRVRAVLIRSARVPDAPRRSDPGYVVCVGAHRRYLANAMFWRCATSMRQRLFFFLIGAMVGMQETPRPIAGSRRRAATPARAGNALPPAGAGEED
jgi:O-antigen ligase